MKKNDKLFMEVFEMCKICGGKGHIMGIRDRHTRGGYREDFDVPFPCPACSKGYCKRYIELTEFKRRMK